MIRKHRITRINQVLTAQERAVLCVRAMLDGVPEDPLIRETMPIAQVEDFNRHLALANGVLHVLPNAFLFAKDVECATLRFSFLSAMASQQAIDLIVDRIPRYFRELWSALLAYEAFVEEVVTEFGDPVVIPKVMSDTIKTARERLLELRKDAGPITQTTLRAPAMDRDLLDALRQSVHRDARVYLHVLRGRRPGSR